MTTVQRKPVKCSVAAVVRHPTDTAAFLAVRRPPDDEALPLVWGLPAVSLKKGELPEAALERLGREKLGVELGPRSFVGIQTAERPGYLLILMDLEAEILAGLPDVHAAQTTGTAYIDQQWTADPLLLAEAARRGSVCSRILLDTAGLEY